MSVVWSGLDAFYKALDKVAADADVAAKEIITTASKTLTRAAQDDFSGAHKRGQPHTGGDQPNIVSGDLRRSITADPVIRQGFADYSVSVGPRMIYGRRVELGYMGDGKGPGHQSTRAFPYFTPAYERVIPQINAIATEVWGRFLKS